MWALLIGLALLGLITAFIGFFQQRKLKEKLKKGEITEIPEPQELDTECCGEHATCEKDSLLSAVSKDIEYYDDEELDTWRHTPANEYSTEAIEEFRHVFYTLQETEVAGWVRSLQLREIELPDEIKDEVLLIVRERRMPH